MAFNSSGQISYLVLDSLAESSKYGLEIIEYISKKTNGTFELKKPTLYSCLTRMEKKGLVTSSFWGESEIGGKRHYYSITNSGRENLKELSQLFSNIQYPASNENQISLFENETPKDDGRFLEEDERIVEDDTISQEKPFEDENVKVEYIENIDNSPQTTMQEPVQDTSPQLTQDQEEQNKVLYDTSTELKKYRNKKSFSQNQIEMSVVYANAEDAEIQRNRIAELKKSLMNIKQNSPANTPQVEKQSENQNFDALNFQKEYIDENIYKKVDKNEGSTTETTEDNSDDAVLITEPRIVNIPIQKKITPPTIDVDPYNNNLPAPNRDANLEPTYKDLVSKLFDKKKTQPEKTETKKTETYEYFSDQTIFSNYDMLKKYYASKNISFSEHEKGYVARKHNTNKLLLINSLIMFLLSAICSSVLYWIVSANGLLQENATFLFILCPALFLAYVVFRFIAKQISESGKAHIKPYECFTKWILAVLFSMIIIVLNILGGMQAETISHYLVTALLPIIFLLIAFPINYHIKRFLYKKYSK